MHHPHRSTKALHQALLAVLIVACAAAGGGAAAEDDIAPDLLLPYASNNGTNATTPIEGALETLEEIEAGMANASSVLANATGILIEIIKHKKEPKPEPAPPPPPPPGPDPPKWPKSFSADFNEKTVHFFQTTGKYYYDSALGLERMDKAKGSMPGSGDKYCQSVHPFPPTSCSHYADDKGLHLYFDELKSCCKCCYKENGCGAPPRDWISILNGTFEGNETFEGVE